MTRAALKTLVTPPSSLVRLRRTSVVSAIVDLSSRLARTCMCACVNACVTGAVALCSVPTSTSSSYADWETVLSLFVRNGKIYQTAGHSGETKKKCFPVLEKVQMLDPHPCVVHSDLWITCCGTQFFCMFNWMRVFAPVLPSELSIQPQLNSTLIPPHARAQTSPASHGECRNLKWNWLLSRVDLSLGYIQ